MSPCVGHPSRPTKTAPLLAYEERRRPERSHSRATLPPMKTGSTIAEAGLNFRVRNGNGCGPRSLESGKNLLTNCADALGQSNSDPISSESLASRQSVSNASRRAHLHGHMVKPHGRLVPVSSTHYCASTSGLSRPSLERPFRGPKSQGDLILGWASHLDAFSGYPIGTWLPGDAPGGTTGTPEVPPSRSSRTRDSSPQISCAHSG